MTLYRKLILEPSELTGQELAEIVAKNILYYMEGGIYNE
mgnify:CR=1 FL=1